MIDFDKFLASFINEMKKHQPITSYNLPGCIKKALKDQGLEYRDGEIIEISAESEDERIKKSLIDGFKRYDDGALFNGCSVREILPWLEKQGEHQKFRDSIQIGDKVTRNEDGVLVNLSQLNRVAKPANIEPKFGIGWWITSNDVHNDFRICKIVGVDVINKCYSIESIDGYKGYNSFETFDKLYYEWTIQDAKKGDVLVNGSNIFIFHFINGTRLMGYCHVNTDDGRFYDDIGKNECFCLIDAVVNPATKEQRELLFQKMKEAGYEWNTEKKELKKIEDEEYNGEDYGIDSLYHAQRILEKTLGEVDGYQTDDGILSHKCAITAVKKLYEQKPAWSEEDRDYYDAIITKLEVTQDDAALTDNQMEFLKSLKDRVHLKQEWSEEDEIKIKSIIAFLKSPSLCAMDGNKGIIDANIKYLKSIKDRVQPQNTWKPSDEQMEALEHFIIHHNGSTNYAKDLEELRIQLKKL